ncbi:unnamed protein product [Paramecium primaurelia]|uniref:Fatty acid hydroxylase domain-containing protein n=1 Tax=Paramecium primaurelia TaxID=5886 RepID=A0A8S1MX04_PARPR|nr:unnamed protein product [Paramecium primaurelia]
MSPVVGSELETLSFTEKHIYINDFKHYVQNVNVHHYKIMIGFIGAIAQYLFCCSLIEYYNPMPKTKLRVQNILKEIRYGIPQLMFGSSVTMTFYYYIYPYTPYYKYFEINEYRLLDLFSIIFQWIWITFNGYWIHRMLHLKYFYQYIHSIHHSFKEPTSFGYCAGHPLEGFLLGTLLLHSSEVLIPIHPLQTMIFGGLYAIRDMLAHDGGKLDYADHYRHHLYYVVNYGHPILDYYFCTSYNPKNYPIKEKCSYVSEFKNKDHPLFSKYS